MPIDVPDRADDSAGASSVGDSRLSAGVRTAIPRAPVDDAGGSGGDRPRLDPEALARLAELDPTGRNRLLERVLQTFLVSIARLRPQFETGWEKQDLAAVRLVAHTLKSSSGSIGATRLADLSAAIENAIRLGELEQLPALVARADAAFDEATSAIRAHLAPSP